MRPLDRHFVSQRWVGMLLRPIAVRESAEQHCCHRTPPPPSLPVRFVNLQLALVEVMRETLRSNAFRPVSRRSVSTPFRDLKSYGTVTSASGRSAMRTVIPDLGYVVPAAKREDLIS